MNRNDWKDIAKALEAGLTLEIHEPTGVRRFTKGQITNEKRDGRTRTTHLSRSLNGYVWLTRTGIAILGEQAREKFARKDEILASQAAKVASFLDT